MKKMIFTALVLMVMTAAAYAQSYTVQEVTGRVEQDLGGGKWEAVKAGDSLKAETIIRTGIGARLTVKTGDQILRVEPSKTGKLADLAGSGAVIQIQGKVAQTDTSAVSRDTARVSTASARASTAAAEIEVAEE